MHKFTGGLIGGLAAGIAIGVGIAMTDDKFRHRMVKENKRRLRKAHHFFDDIRDIL